MFQVKYDDIKEKFSNCELVVSNSGFDKLRVLSTDLVAVLKFLKNNPEFDFQMINSIIGLDLVQNFEIIYDLYSISLKTSIKVSVLIDKKSPKCPSVVEVFKSAHFDECEIFDMFGIDFLNNHYLKRLLMPKGWLGYPLRKDYVQNDERLSWNSKDGAK